MSILRPITLHKLSGLDLWGGSATPELSKPMDHDPRMSISTQILMMMLVWGTRFENHWSRWGAKQEWLIGKSTFNQWKKAMKEEELWAGSKCQSQLHSYYKKKNLDRRDQTTTNTLQQVYRDMKTWSQKRNFICLLVHEIDWDMNRFFCPFNFAEIQYRSKEPNRRQQFLLQRAVYHFNVIWAVTQIFFSTIHWR